MRAAQAFAIAAHALFNAADAARRGARGNARMRHRAGAKERNAAEEGRAEAFAADLIERKSDRQRDCRVREIEQHVRDDGHFLPSESQVARWDGAPG